VGANFINPFPVVAGVCCVDARRASSMNFNVRIVGHFFVVMSGALMFFPVVGLVVGSWAPVVLELALGILAM
jgi:hypothetical protein